MRVTRPVPLVFIWLYCQIGHLVGYTSYVTLVNKKRTWQHGFLMSSGYWKEKQEYKCDRSSLKKLNSKTSISFDTPGYSKLTTKTWRPLQLSIWKPGISFEHFLNRAQTIPLTKSVHKVKKVCHTKIFFNVNTGTEYTSFGTYLRILSHTVTSDIKALVPWHVVACLFNQVKTASFRSSSFAKRLHARSSFIFRNRKKYEGARSGFYGGSSKLSQWNSSSSRACVCWAVCGRVINYNKCTVNVTGSNIFRLQKTNNTSYLTVGGIFNPYSYLCTYHVARSDVQLHEAFFNITQDTMNQWSAATKQVHTTVWSSYYKLVEGIEVTLTWDQQMNFARIYSGET